jgi:hypothetical protein
MQLAEVYERLHRYGPEFGGDEEGNHGMTNHGPMAAEVMTRRALDIDITRWLDRYVRRLDELPPASQPIADWAAALGDARRLPDWQAWFAARLDEQLWTEVLAIWWPRLLPGIAAGSTHGVIRVGHAVRALRAGGGAPARAELAHGLAFWAARYLPLPAAQPTGILAAGPALRQVTRLPEQSGFVASRAARLPGTAGWAASIAAIRPAAPGQEPAALAELVAAAVRQYPDFGPAAPVLLVHTATAPNAVRHVLPSLPSSLWADSFRHAWTAVAAIQAMYAPVRGSAHALHLAAEHGDEHVLKFTDTAVDAFDAAGDPALLAAAAQARDLIARP